MKLYLFDKWEGARSFSRDERGLVTTTCEDDSLPETMASHSPAGTLCVWKGTIYDPRKLTDDELDELGISPEEARECDEWWQGKMRPATDAEILAVLSFAPNTHTPALSVATPDARRVVDLTSAFLPDAKWAAWLLLHAGQQGVNEHRQMMAHSVTLTGRIEELERALAATTPDAQGGGA